MDLSKLEASAMDIRGKDADESEEGSDEDSEAER